MRIIECKVTNEYVRGAGQVIGAAGSHNDVALRLAFGEMWHGLAKSIVWLDALGENPVLTLLTVDMLAAGETEVYIVPIPAEPKALEGKARATIRGAAVSGETEAAATLSATAEFTVLRSDYVAEAGSPESVTPDAATQLRAEIEDIKEDIVAVRSSADEAAGSAAAAQEAQTAAEAARTAAEEAAGESAGSALLAESWAVGGTGTRAGEDTDNSKYYAGRAEAAESTVTAAKTAAESAATAATAARTAAETAQGAAEAAAQTAGNAAADSLTLTATATEAAESAAADATAAANAADTATAAAEAAAASATSAATDATRAEAAAEQAESVAGGDFATRTEAQGYANTAETNAKQYADEKVAALVDSAPETLDTLAEVATAIQENEDVVAALNSAIGSKAADADLTAHTTNGTIHVTAADKEKWDGKQDELTLPLSVANGGTGKNTAPLALYNLISGSAALASSGLATGDYIPVGDVSAATGKKVTLANLLSYISSNGAGGSAMLEGTAAPTTATVGEAGQHYWDKTNSQLYICTAVSGSTYTWTPVTTGAKYTKQLFTEIITSSMTWTAPSGIIGSVSVRCFGGGGGGANAVQYQDSDANSYYLAGGGGGGHMNTATATVAPGAAVPITVGSGGAVGGNGGATSFGSYCSASGGNCGTGTNSGRASGSGGAGGTGGGGAGFGGAGGAGSYGGGGGGGCNYLGSPESSSIGGAGGTYGGGGGGYTGGAKGTYGGAGGGRNTAGSAGTNTNSITGLDFRGSGTGGSSGAAGGGGGGYGGNGGAGSAFGGGGGGGYGANGGAGNGVYGKTTASTSQYSGGGGGGGGYGGAGKPGLSHGYGFIRGAGGGGGGYGSFNYGAGGNGGCSSGTAAQTGTVGCCILTYYCLAMEV